MATNGNDKKDSSQIFQEEAGIRESLSERTPRYPEYSMKQTSAVLIPLLEMDGELQILFEKRASALHSQPGEVCLPGGRFEPGESAVQAAVREAMEELLIEREQMEILGEMDGIMGPAGAPVWPVVAILHHYRNTWSADEVERTFMVPLQWFRENRPEIYEAHVVTKPGEDFPYDLIPGGRSYPWHEKRHLVYFYRTGRETIWGLTGHIIASFISRYAGTTLSNYIPQERLSKCI